MTPEKNGVVAVLQDARQRFLFIQRGFELQRAPGVWCFVGGEVNPGEVFTRAIERECMEEVGLRVEALGKVHESVSPNGEYLLHWLRVQPLDLNLEISPHPVEVASFRWLPPEEGLLLEPILPTLREWLLGQGDGDCYIHRP